MSRTCDQVARDAVGADRAPAIYNAPARDAVELKVSDEEVEHGPISDRNRMITGKGLSTQAVSIIDAIDQVDRFLQASGPPRVPDALDAFGSLVESHPEVCFRTFADTELEHSKASAAGVSERLDALEGDPPLFRDPQLAVRDISDDLRRNHESGVAIDDVLDALVLAITAAAANE